MEQSLEYQETGVPGRAQLLAAVSLKASRGDPRRFRPNLQLSQPKPEPQPFLPAPPKNQPS